MGHKGQAPLLGDETAKSLQKAELLEVETLARRQTKQSLDSIQALRDDGAVDPRIRLAAAQAILEWGWGKTGARGKDEKHEATRGGVQVLLVSYNAQGEAVARELERTRVESPIEAAKRQLQQGDPCDSTSSE